MTPINDRIREMRALAPSIDLDDLAREEALLLLEEAEVAAEEAQWDFAAECLDELCELIRNYAR